MAFAQKMTTFQTVKLGANPLAYIPARQTVRSNRFIVRAEGPEEVAKKVESTLENEVGPAARDAVETTTRITTEATSPAAQKTTFGELMAFSGYAPERVNSRLAMLGIVAALGAEASTGKGLFEQINIATGPIAITFALFIAASVIPILKGQTADKAQNGVWSSKAELWNGRLAMLGFLGLVLTEALKGSPLLQ